MKKSIFAILLLASLSSVGQVVTAPMPSPRFQVFTSAGLPLAGGCLFSYQAGTSTPLATYKDNLGVAQNSNPVLLDSTGSADVWLGPQKYKLQLFSAGGVNCASGSLLWTRDGVYGPNLPVTTTLALIAQTAPSCVAASYTIWADSSATRFKMCNNGTADVVVGANTSDTLTNKTLTSPTLNNPSVANPTITGGGSLAGTFTGNPSFTGAVSIKSLNLRLMADAFTGSDACAKINAAWLAQASFGGIVDANGFQGNQPCGSNPFAGVTNYGQLFLGAATYQTTAQWVLPNRIAVIGVGRGDSGVDNTVIEAVAGFPINTPVVRLGSGTIVHGTRLSNLTVDCNGIAGSTGVYSTDLNEQAGLDRLDVANCPSIGVNIDGTAAGDTGAANFNLSKLEIYPGTFGSGSTIGLQVKTQQASFGTISDITANGLAGHLLGTGVLIDNTAGGTLNHLHHEQVATGLQVALNASAHGVHGLVANDVSCGVAYTDCAKISNAAQTRNVTLNNISGYLSPANNTVNDVISTLTRTDYSIPQYGIDENAAPFFSLATGGWQWSQVNALNLLIPAKYNSIATVSNGVPSEYATIDLTAQNNNIGNASLYVVPASGAGLYRVSCYVVVTTAAGTSSTLPNCNLLWTDKDNSQAQTIAIATGGSGNTLTTLAQGTVVVNVKASTTMQYSTTGYASNAANAMQYAIHIKLEAL